MTTRRSHAGGAPRSRAVSRAALARGLSRRDGAVYASIGPAVVTFVQNQLADVCSGVSDGGLCRGAQAIRCTREDEGERRLTRTDCEIFGQTCGLDAEGAAACVDP